MTHLISRRWTKVLLILIPLFLSSACLTLTGSSPSQTQAPEVTGGPPGDSQDPGMVIVEGEVAFGPGSFIFPDTKAGLSDLTSYEATLILSFDGTRNAKTVQWSKTYVLLTTKDPEARQLSIEKAGDLSDLAAVFMAEMDGTGYERQGENVCTATEIEPGNSLGERLEPAGFLTGVHGAEETGQDTVNGVAANRYTFDERALGQLGIAKSTGEIWVASDGGYIVSYRLATEGNADYFGEATEGTITWDYELTDANQPIAILLPKDCPGGLVDAPLFTDAADVVNLPGLLRYTSLTSLAEAAAFYQQQLPALGWQPTADPVIGETTALLDFTQADQLLSVIITTGDMGTTIHIFIF